MAFYKNFFFLLHNIDGQFNNVFEQSIEKGLYLDRWYENIYQKRYSLFDNIRLLFTFDTIFFYILIKRRN